MSDPKGLSFGKPIGAPSPAPAAFATPVTPAVGVQMRPAGVPTGQALAPFTLAEVVDYGKPAAMAASAVSAKITGSARAGDIDEVGVALNKLLTGAQQYDPSKLGKGGFMGFFKRKKRELDSHFNTVNQSVTALAGDVQKHIGHFQGRIGDLEALKAENEARYHELGAAMVKANERIAWMEANPPQVDASNPMSAQHRQNWQTVIDYAKKRVDDLRRAQVLCEMQQPQIEMMQTNAGMLVMKFGEVQTTTLPQLQMGFSLYIANMEAAKGADFSKQIDDTNNDLISRNAAQLGVTTVKVREQMARSSVDLVTLQKVKDELFKTMDETKRIQSELSTRLAAEAPLLEQQSQDLANRLAAA